MIIGHKRQLKFLKKILKSEKIPQTYLFCGPESVGKFTIAKLFAIALIYEDTNFELKKDTGNLENEQDIEILSPEVIEKKGIIKVKDFEIKRVRKVQKDLMLFPALGKFRILIINDAHRLNISSQNALLKTLEEPNQTSIIILITNNDEKILDTVKSRCRKINFNLVGLEEIKNNFQGKVGKGVLDKLVVYSMGKPGEANIIFQNTDAIIERDKIIEDLKKLNLMSNIQKFALAESYSKNLPESIKKMELWMWFLRFQAYRKIKNDTDLEVFYGVIDKIDRALKKLKTPNLNSRLILENLFLKL